MVIVRLNGGLGNQLFQYAIGRALSHRRQVPLKLDTAAISSDPLREYRLDNFHIVAEAASSDDVARVTGKEDRTFFGSLRRRVEARLPYYRRRVVKERHYHQFDPNIFRARRSVYLHGYWQCEGYFKDIRNIIRDEMRVRAPVDEENRRVIDRIASCQSVSLHVRRGDYVSDRKTNEGHGVCSLDYYQDAVSRLGQLVSEPRVFVFSDDMPWAEEHLQLPFPTEFVRCNGAERDYLDLHLMRRCKHHIIANSTFSWWGAWLSDDAQKKVIAPAHWFNKKERDTNDLIPSTWIRM